ncbi:MAG TPA: peptidoglycan DD-metalloendopeptidase family protein [Burkholderiales bacterium]|nr:peptidoglycan DD-metalloendopeptidase family protein [Burkholderiales bacterium]
MKRAAVLLVLLVGCGTAQKPAPVVDRKQPARPPTAAAKPAPAAAAEGSYVVRKGDTLYSIALEHGADYREVAQWNRLDDPTKISVGQVLRVVPPEERSVQVGRAKIPERGEARPLDLPPPQGAQARKPPPAAEKAPPAPAQSAAADFIWPARGKVIAGFAEPRRKGIDIDAKLGDPVIASAAGRVTYTGTGIPGLGKLVVIKHDNGFITVYAHNRDILVKEQQPVKRGQKIAEVGNTDADRPKLHFQIRKGSAAVDPMRYLPAL